jgi:hypothetical protein
MALWDTKCMASPHTPISTSTHLLRPVKDRLGLRISSVYRILCECSRVSSGQTDRSVDIRLKQHQWHIQLEHMEKSAVSEHSIDH